MSFFDDALQDAVPGGSLATPIAVAAGALLLHHFFGGGAPAQAQAPAPAPAPPAGGGGFLEGGGLIGGLSGLVGKLASAGAGPQVNSWVGNGPNQPIDPTHLGNALGADVLSQLAARTGLSQQQIVEGLSQVLPQLVNNLTPNGRLPTAAEAQYGR
ncbi:MAG: DUF937 domain-containing protein [Pseudomonadota bacterium]|nr:DUF937 domain-containing protein [Pseudomonadota bacterium]